MQIMHAPQVVIRGEGSRLVIELGKAVHQLISQKCSAQVVAQSPGSAHNNPSVDELVVEVGVIGVVRREWDFWMNQRDFREKVRFEGIRELKGVASQDDVCAEGLKGFPQVPPAGQEDCVLGVCPYDKLIIGDAPAQAVLPSLVHLVTSCHGHMNI